MDKLLEDPDLVPCLQRYMNSSASPAPLKQRELNVTSNRSTVERALSVLEHFSQGKSLPLKTDTCRVISLSFSVVSKSQGGITLSSPFCQDLAKRRQAFIVRLLNQNQFQLALAEIYHMVHTARNALSLCPSKQAKIDIKDLLKGVPFDPKYHCGVLKKLAISLHVLLLQLILKDSAIQRSAETESRFCNMADVCDSLKGDGNLYKWIMSLDKEERQKRCSVLSKICHGLSTSVFTVWKLCFLSKSQEFKHLSGQPLELKELESVFHLMFGKNPSMVRDYAGSFLRELWKLCKHDAIGRIVKKMEEGIVSSSPSKISCFFERLAAGLFDDATKITEELEKPYELPPQAISLINRATRRVIEKKSSTEGVCALICLLSGAKYDQVILPYLDALTVNIKTWCPATHADSIKLNLDTLLNAYHPQKDVKRIRLLSNLLYHFGQSVLSSDVNLAIDFWQKCIEYEASIDPKGENLKSKCERMINILIDEGLYTLTAFFCKKVFLTVDHSDNLFQLNTIFETRLDRTMKLVCKILMNSAAAPITLSHFSSSLRVKSVIAFRFFHMVSSYRFPHKTSVVNKLLQQCCAENDVESAAMVYLAYREVGGIDDVLPFPLSVKEYPMWESFVLFNELIYGDFDDEKLKSCMSSLGRWLQIEESNNPFQHSQVTKILDYLHHQGLHQNVFSVVDQFTENKSTELMEDIILKRQRSENLVKEWKTKSFKTTPEHHFEATLLNLERCIQVSDIEKAEKLSVEILKLMQTDGKLRISNKMGRAQMVSALYQHARFCHVYSHLCFKKAAYITAVVNSKRCLRILQSLLKRFLPSLLQYDYSNGVNLRLAISSSTVHSFDRLLNLFEHLGMAKDGEYYADELVKLIGGIQPLTPVIAGSSLCRCSIFYSLSGDLQRSAKLLERADCLEQGQQFHDLRLSAHTFHDSTSLNELANLVRSSQEGQVCDASWKAARFLASGVTLEQFLHADLLESEENQILLLKNSLFQLKRKLTETPILSSAFESVMMMPSLGGIIHEGLGSSCRIVLEKIESTMQSGLLKLSSASAKNLIDQYVFVNQMLSRQNWKEIISETDWSRLPSMATEQQLLTFPDDPSKLLPEMSQPDDSLSFSNEELMKLLPRSWLTVTIDFCSETGDLLLARLTHESSMVVRLPLGRHVSRDLSCEKVELADVVETVQSIIRQSDLSTKSERTSSIKTKEDREQWWRERKSLDSQLKRLLFKIEEFWLGGFRGVFSVQDTRGFSRLKDGVEKIFSEHFPIQNISNEIVRLLISLGDPSKVALSKQVEDLVYFVLDSLVFQGVQIEYDELDMDQICAELESLLENYYEAVVPETEYHHTVLVVGKKCHFIPWESLPCMRNSSVSRVLSLKHLTKLLKNHQMAVSKKNGFYMLNPAGDLARTESRFDTKFASLQTWNGLVCTKPSEEEFVGCLKGNLFVYMGHGGGEQYVRSKTIKKLDKVAPSLLLGCSSGSLKDDGFLDPYGTVLNYLGGGCPMVLANMWDVTDKDIDKFSLVVFEKWGLFESGFQDGSMNICQAVTQSRASCHLKYLNGAAPVVYGLPLSLT